MSTPLRICLIDDNLAVRAALAFGLREAGHDVTEAGDGAAGIHAVRESNPDVVVTDLTLPDMRGAQVVRAIRGVSADIPIVAISGGSGEEPCSAAELGADVFLTKPFKMKELSVALADAMSRHGR